MGKKWYDPLYENDDIGSTQRGAFPFGSRIAISSEALKDFETKYMKILRNDNC